MKKATLEEVLPWLKTGDQFCFGSNTRVSQLVEHFTDSEISHVATVVWGGGLGWLVCEAGAHGVVVRPLAHVLDEWLDAWWLPVVPVPDEEDLLAAVNADLADHVAYAYKHLVVYAIGRRRPTDFTKRVCSEESARLLFAGGLYDGPWGLTPIEVARLRIYGPDYYALKWEGDQPKPIDGFNSTAPDSAAFAGLAPDLGRILT